MPLHTLWDLCGISRFKGVVECIGWELDAFFFAPVLKCDC